MKRHLRRRLGRLCIDADHARTNDDFAALQHIARSLAIYAHEPLHCQLVDLADTCQSDVRRASSMWDQLKDRVFAVAAA